MSITESSFSLLGSESDTDETLAMSKQKIVVVGAGPVGALAAIYAAQRGHDVEIYELRNGKDIFCFVLTMICYFVVSFNIPPFISYVQRSRRVSTARPPRCRGNRLV
jgi:kynurenine 3-monooxygenase